MKFMSRKEILQVFPECRAPDTVRTALVDAGIMTSATSEAGEIIYTWALGTFAGIPDNVLSILYSELQEFTFWYEERTRFLASDDKAELPIWEFARLYEKYRLNLGVAPAFLITADVLETYAKAFARRFIAQWRRYQ